MAITIYELEQRLTNLEQSLYSITERLDRSEALFSSFRAYVNTRFEEIFERFARIDSRLNTIEEQMVTQSDLIAMESRLKDFILTTFQKPS